MFEIIIILLPLMNDGFIIVNFDQCDFKVKKKIENTESGIYTTVCNTIMSFEFKWNSN